MGDSEECYDQALERELLELLTAAQAFHGQLEIPAAIYYRRLMQSMVSELSVTAELSQKVSCVRRLFSADLYLTTACARGSSCAWSRFLDIYNQYIVNCVRAACRNQAIVDEVSGSVVSDLFLADRSGVSRIGSYDGRCPLRAWLRRLIENRCINESARHYHRFRCDESCAIKLIDRSATPEAALDEREWLANLEADLTAAFARLSDRERQMLFLRFGQERSLVEISSAYGLHLSTVSRAITQALRKIRVMLEGAPASGSYLLLRDAVGRIVHRTV